MVYAVCTYRKGISRVALGLRRVQGMGSVLHFDVLIGRRRRRASLTAYQGGGGGRTKIM